MVFFNLGHSNKSRGVFRKMKLRQKSLDPMPSVIRTASRNLSEIQALAHMSEADDIAVSLIEAFCEIDKRLNNQVSQLAQDAMALSLIGEGGKFLEIGGGDGFHLSNTFALWRKFGWGGDIVEPLPRFHKSISLLIKEVPSVKVHNLAMYSSCGALQLLDVGELSSFIGHLDQDDWAATRLEALEKDGTIVVEALCPTAFLIARGWPNYDFVSLDVEGGEFDVLLEWPWEFSAPRFLCVETVGNEERIEKIDNLVLKHGYSRVLARASLWDSWYVRDRKRIESVGLPTACKCMRNELVKTGQFLATS